MVRVAASPSMSSRQCRYFDGCRSNGMGSAAMEKSYARIVGRMRVSSTNGVTVAVHDMGGAGDAPPLLIAHATGFSGPCYQQLAAALVERFHVWAIDFRGHGDSSEPDDGDYAWTGMADDLLAATDAVGVERWYGFGHSLGGGVLFL